MNEFFIPKSCGGNPVVEAVCAACPFSHLCYGEKVNPGKKAE